MRREGWDGITSSPERTDGDHAADLSVVLATADMESIDRGLASLCAQTAGGRIEVVLVSLSGGTLCVVDQSGRVLRQPRVARSSHDACFVVSA